MNFQKIIGSETDDQPYLRSTWKFYDVMSNALGLEREISRVKLSMMVNNSLFNEPINTESTTPLVNALESNSESTIATSMIPTTNLLSDPKMCDPLPFTAPEIKIETNEFEFDTMFVEEQHDESMLQCTPIDNLLSKPEPSYENSEPINNITQPNILHLINPSNEVRIAPATSHLRSILKGTPAVIASTSHAYSMRSASGVIQSNHGATSDVLSSCSSDDATPPNKRSSTSKRGKKRKNQFDNDEIWEYIKKGDEEIRNDFKQLIEIQRKTSEHIGSLVHYLINKDKQ